MKLIIDPIVLAEILESLDRGDNRFDDLKNNKDVVTLYLDGPEDDAEGKEKIYDFPALKQPRDLESILQDCFGCKKPFLKRKKLVGVWNDGTKDYDTLTKKGAEAYEKLVSALYGLELIGVIADANHVIETLDSIASGKDY